MSRSFNSVGALAAFLEGMARSLPEAQRGALDEASRYALDRVPEIIGHYQSNPAWPKLAEATVKDRVSKGFTPDDPLKRTGDFGKTFARTVEGPTRASIGSNDERAEWFERGTRKMPPRPVLGAVKAQNDPRLVEIVGRRLQRHLAGGTNNV